MNEEQNGKHCELCKKRIATPEKFAGAAYLCDNCKPTLKTCANGDCKNTRLCPETGWWGAADAWCWLCIKKVDEAADMLRDDLISTRASGLEDAGTLTRVEDKAGNPSYVRRGK